jgi:hypothetical protein
MIFVVNNGGHVDVNVSAANNGLVLGFRMFMERSFPSFDPFQVRFMGRF